MTEEEYFIKHYPDVCYNGKPLSPYWDLFQDGVEFGERQSEKKIEELTSELTKKADTNHLLVEQMADLESKNAELKTKVENQKSFLERIRAKFELGEIERKEIEGYLESEQLTKAKEILKEFARLEYADYTDGDYSNELSKVLEQAEQFLKEIEK